MDAITTLDGSRLQVEAPALGGEVTFADLEDDRVVALRFTAVSDGETDTAFIDAVDRNGLLNCTLLVPAVALDALCAAWVEARATR